MIGFSVKSGGCAERTGGRRLWAGACGSCSYGMAAAVPNAAAGDSSRKQRGAGSPEVPATGRQLRPRAELRRAGGSGAAGLQLGPREGCCPDALWWEKECCSGAVRGGKRARQRWPCFLKGKRCEIKARENF